MAGSSRLKSISYPFQYGRRVISREHPGIVMKLDVNKSHFESMVDAAQKAAALRAKYQSLYQMLTSIPVSRDAPRRETNLRFQYLKSLLRKSTKFLSVCRYSSAISTLGNQYATREW